MIRASLSVVALLALAASQTPAMAQSSSKPVQQQGTAADQRFTFELSAGGVFTTVDKMKWAGVASPLLEWNEYGWQVDGRLFFKPVGRFLLGAEGGYRYFWYYEANLGTGSRAYYDVAATRFAGVARVDLTSLVSVDFGPAMYLFEEFTDFGASGALVFKIPVAKIRLPLHVRTDVVFDKEALMMGSGVTLGWSQKF